VERSNLHEESIVFSKAMCGIINTERWSISTTNSAFRALRKILEKTNIDKNFITKISLQKQIERKVSYLPQKYRNETSDDKLALEEIIALTKTRTRMKSDSSIRLFMSFIVKLLEKHNIPLTKYRDVAQMSYEDIHRSIVDMNQPKLFHTHMHYAMIFLCNILQNQNYLKQFEAEKRSHRKEFGVKEDHDVHRITKEELEAMYKATADDIRLRAILLLMVSTGMRTFGVSNIKLCNVCTIVNNNVIINKIGRTIEKGNKWFTFPISDLLSEVLYTYITTTRKSNSEYLFSSMRCSNLTPNAISATIKKIATTAGLSGKHIHAHSIRHSFAHILLETGNRPEMVSKMLGHSSTSTTEHYYLKESAAEASKRMNIPWLMRQENYDPVPNFLQANTTKATQKRGKSSALKAIINDFSKCERESI
jgi:integrase/recombinase XerD